MEGRGAWLHAPALVSVQQGAEPLLLDLPPGKPSGQQGQVPVRVAGFAATLSPSAGEDLIESSALRGDGAPGDRGLIIMEKHDAVGQLSVASGATGLLIKLLE